MEEEVGVRLVQLPDVLVVECREFRIGALALAEASPQDVTGTLKKDHEIGGGNVLREQFVQSLVNEQLVVVEVQVGVDLVPIEQVVADGELAEKVALPERGLLPVAR